MSSFENTVWEQYARLVERVHDVTDEANKVNDMGGVEALSDSLRVVSDRLVSLTALASEAFVVVGGGRRVFTDDFEHLVEFGEGNGMIREGVENLNFELNGARISKLTLQKTSLENVEALARLPHLEEVHLIACKSTDWNCIAALTNIKKLALTELYSVVLAGVTQLTQLQSLSTGYAKVSSLKPFVPMKDLKVLELKNSNIISLSDVGLLPRLESLDLSDGQLASLKGVEKHPRLQHLAFRNCGFNDLSPLRDLPTLRTLDIRGTNCRQSVVLAWLNARGVMIQS